MSKFSPFSAPKATSDVSKHRHPIARRIALGLLGMFGIVSLLGLACAGRSLGPGIDLKDRGRHVLLG